MTASDRQNTEYTMKLHATIHNKDAEARLDKAYFQGYGQAMKVEDNWKGNKTLTNSQGGFKAEVFTGQIPFVSPNQERHSTDGSRKKHTKEK